MPRTTIHISDEQAEDLRACREQTGMNTSHLLMTLYESYRKGDITLAALPDGGQVNGPIAKRRRRSP
jgi:hypothetical protein